jgi:DNA-binding response OmpR family regulator
MDSAVILIVDDERSFGEVVAQRLRQRGFTANTVQNLNRTAYGFIN